MDLQHTLVIPTYNRPGLLARLVRHYYRHAGAPQLLVLDSSAPETAAHNARALAYYGPSLRHVTFPQNLPMAAKLAEGLSQVQTQYSSFCADDDLVFTEGLRQAIEFLATHEDYVCAHGLYINFRQDGQDVHITREYAGPGNTAEHAGARIFRLCQKYESLFYAVFRTSDLADIFSAAQHVPSLHYQELFQSVAALIKGKVERLPVIYAGRQSCEAAEPERDRWQTHYWFAADPSEFLQHYAEYREDVMEFYARHASAPRAEAETLGRVLDITHSMYFSVGCSPHYLHSVLKPLWPLDEFEPERSGTDMFEGAVAALPRFHPARMLLAARMRATAALQYQWLQGRWPRLKARMFAGYVARLNAALTANVRLSFRPEDAWLSTLPQMQRSCTELARYLED